MASPEDMIEAVAAIAAPQIGVSLRLAKIIAFAVLALIVACVLGWVMWKLFFAERKAQAKHDQVQTQAQIGTANAGKASGTDAIKITVDNSKAAAGIDAAVREALNAIAKTKGADQRLDPALDDLGRQSICLRLSAASLPDCQHLQRLDP